MRVNKRGAIHAIYSDGDQGMRRFKRRIIHILDRDFD